MVFVKEINVFDYAGEILKALPKGILLTSEAEDCINAMTIGWGTIGIEWGVPIFTAYVRESRFTMELLERTGEFTICVPYGEKYSKEAAKIVGMCGSLTGRVVDKLAKSGAHLVDAEMIRPPAIRELPLTIECRVIFEQVQPIKSIYHGLSSKFYPTEDPHIAYYGQILKAYILDD